MSPNRKADLQRKLAMAPIPKPPAGLSERIKSDIPQHLLVDARKERERFSRSVAFNLRVAASIILLVGSVYLALHVLTRAELERAAMEKPSNVVIARKEPAQPPAVAAPARIAENAPPVAALPRPVAAPPAEEKPVIVAEAKTEPLARRERSRNVDAVAGGSAAGIAEPSAPPPPAPVPMPPPEPPPVALQQAAEAASADAAPRAAAKVTSGFVPEANAAPLTLAPATLFDIAVPRAGAELRGAALVQHFAAPAAAPRALRVDAEAAMLEETPLLRVSIDTPEVPHAAGGSRPPVAAQAKLEIVFDDDAVVSHRALAGTAVSTEPSLPSSASVTALFALELKPNLPSRATIATVTLHYNSVVDGKPHEITRRLRRSDVRDWEKATRRMKATSLAAAAADSLAPKEEVVEKARAAGLRELAATVEKH